MCILASINSILFRSLDMFTIFIFILFKTIDQTPSTAFWVTRFLEHKIAVDFSANHRGQHCSWFYHLRNLIQEENVSFLKNFIRRIYSTWDASHIIPISTVKVMEKNLVDDLLHFIKSCHQMLEVSQRQRLMHYPYKFLVITVHYCALKFTFMRSAIAIEPPSSIIVSSITILSVSTTFN